MIFLFLKQYVIVCTLLAADCIQIEIRLFLACRSLHAGRGERLDSSVQGIEKKEMSNRH